MLCETRYGYLKLLDNDKTVLLELRHCRSDQKPKHVAASKTVVVSLSPVKLLQFISINPKVKFGQETGLKRECDAIAFFKKELYFYSL